MAKPSEAMKKRIKATGKLSPDAVEWYANAFEANYSFNQQPAQSVVDAMFEVFVSGALASASMPGCGPVRCATCDGRCGK